MLFNGANVGEDFDLSANGDRARFFRNVGNITMDTHEVESVDLAVPRRRRQPHRSAT